MKLSIKQKKISFLIDKYTIFENKELIFTAKTQLFSIPTRLDLINKTGQHKGTIKKAITLFFPEFEIIFDGGWTLTAEGKSWLYDIFTIRIPEGVIELHRQKGLKFAIFQNKEQIAEISKNRIKYFKGDEYEIIANSDVNREFLILICLAWDMHNSNNSNTVSIDLGNIGPIKRISEKSWQPIR